MIWNTILNLAFVLFFSFSSPHVMIGGDALLVQLKPFSPPAPWDDKALEKSAVLAADDRFFLFTSRADQKQPIASITKLMTALVFMDNNSGWEEVYEIRPDDRIEGGRLNLFLGEKVLVRDLFYTSLIASDNGATMALVHSTGLSEEHFVELMNDKAKSLSLLNTSFSDPIGLGSGNISTAEEVALLARQAFLVPEIRQATVEREYAFQTEDGRDKLIESTDDLLYVSVPNGPEILGGKTGYTEEAGYCYVGYMRGPSGRTVISVVLGASDRNNRFRASRELAQWALDNFQWTRY